MVKLLNSYKKRGKIVAMIMRNDFNQFSTYVFYRGSMCPVVSTAFTESKPEA